MSEQFPSPDEPVTADGDRACAELKSQINRARRTIEAARRQLAPHEQRSAEERSFQDD